MYDPFANKWFSRAPLQQARHAHVTGVINDKIYVAGGHNYPPIMVLSSAEFYTPDMTGSNPQERPVHVPNKIGLSQNHPNPFNPRTRIQFTIASRQWTIVKVVDPLGKEVTTLVNEVTSPGTYTVDLDGSNLASGVHFYMLQAGDVTQTKRLFLLK